MSDYYAKKYGKVMAELVGLKAGDPENEIQIKFLNEELDEIEANANAEGGAELKNLIWEKGSWGVF